MKKHYQPPPWNSGDILYNTDLKRTAHFKGSGGWIVGQYHEWVIVIPMLGMNVEWQNMEEWWDIRHVEHLGKFTGLHAVPEDRGTLH